MNNISPTVAFATLMYVSYVTQPNPNLGRGRLAIQVYILARQVLILAGMCKQSLTRPNM